MADVSQAESNGPANGAGGGGNGQRVGTAAIKWAAVVIIVVAILYFLARFVIPLFPQA